MYAIQQSDTNLLASLALTTNDLAGTKRVPDVDIRLRHLTEDQYDLNNLLLHVCSGLPAAGHDVQQSRRQRVEQALSDEHPAEVVLRRRTLKLEHATDAIERMDDQFGLVGVILV